MHFSIQHNEISKTHLCWFLTQKKSFYLQASVIDRISVLIYSFLHISTVYIYIYVCVCVCVHFLLLYIFSTNHMHFYEVLYISVKEEISFTKVYR
jgi:hypothetical protein